MSKEHDFIFEGHARRVTHKTTVVTYKNRVYAEPGDYIVEFDDEDLAFVCSPEQYERLFAEKPKKEKPKTSETTSAKEK